MEQIRIEPAEPEQSNQEAAKALLWGDIVKPTVPHGCHSALVGQANFIRAYLASIAQGAKA